jgi:hypothetical protein
VTLFATVYNRFLGKITDDMYLELTPQDTLRDLRNLLLDAIPGFEFPRKDLYSYVINIDEIDEVDLLPDDFVLGTMWEELPEPGQEVPKVLVDRSYFEVELTSEEINILALLMK